MRSSIGWMLSTALAACLITACQRAETPAPGETPPAQEPATEASAPAEPGADSSLNASLSGAEEVPGPGDADGSGTAQVTLDEAGSQVCYELGVQNIQSSNAAHIHKGASGTAGDVVVNLDPPAQGSSKSCAPADAALVRDIAQNPAGYYVNVHNAEFPKGAVRGQLQR